VPAALTWHLGGAIRGRNLPYLPHQGDYCDRRVQLHNASRNIVRIYSHRRVAIQLAQETLANGSGGADTTTRLSIDCPTLPTQSGLRAALATGDSAGGGMTPLDAEANWAALAGDLPE